MSSASRIGVMVVDDHPIMRSGLRDVLEASGRLEVVGQAEDGDEALSVNAKLELCHFRQVGSDPPGLLLLRSLSPFGWSDK